MIRVLTRVEINRIVVIMIASEEASPGKVDKLLKDDEGLKWGMKENMSNLATYVCKLILILNFLFISLYFLMKVIYF